MNEWWKVRVEKNSNADARTLRQQRSRRNGGIIIMQKPETENPLPPRIL